MSRSLILQEPTISRGRLFGFAAIVFFSFLLFYLVNAATIPSRFSVDDHLNYAATLALAEQHQLPIIRIDTLEALAPRIQFSNVGATRSLRPPLTYIISAGLYASTESLVKQRAFRVRLGSVLLGALVIGLVFGSAYLLCQHVGLALAAAVVIGLSPRFVILASTNNDDIGAIFSVAALLFASLLVTRSNACVSALFAFAIACGLTLQSKYTAWLCLPWFLFYIAPIVWRQRHKLIRWIPALIMSAIVAGAWWPIWNMYHYGWSDPSGLDNAAAVQMYLTDGVANQRGYWSRGVGLVDLLSGHQSFFGTSLASMVGYLAWIDVSPVAAVYWFYGGVLITAIVFCLYRILFSWDRLASIALGILFTLVGFFVHHNLLRDVQPDGRYLLPALLPMVIILISRMRGTSRSKSWLASLFITLGVGLFSLNYVRVWLHQGVFW
ncbi:hypothetical protein GCM10008090_00140 [Arenicella chitinivorans]|uniref:Glycosyltransferase RgtA/B/C/D-like domain-containing protein n=1 Tax=Arenicella chitinivorans TaxID=1329800 RepID=A0A918REL4_9GAMM|nr:glycosyltransferase family 39 protein [Arenicella chitinivorans]GGZ95940.1 hypothetical protein GCM10008090_00140 [Arenicella chitinivorans]